MKKFLILMIVLLSSLVVEATVCRGTRKNNCCQLRTHHREKPYLLCLNSKQFCQNTANKIKCCCDRGNGTWKN